ncbi:DNA polymerase III, delta prime subunit [Salinihabitans flavidus]|uniref:DNA polymerase III, delta prime subunit n=1 Tax=Salinihabitans flavidus TaxID=569882 RepID=A0A1H8WAP2_9RHOB|nr:DNA polymerase III subunit delta' [Salinihabitans flavidus]SEP24726.1 DNA polymerase III, delta prime subunit [Salinihabitans flavidus]
MSEAPALPEPDRVEGAPHPRETAHLIGQDAAVQGFLSAMNADRLHHAWLLTGPRGVGKATFAWSAARFLLATPLGEGGGLFGDAPPAHDTLDVAPDHPVFRRIAALSEPGLFLLRRGANERGDRLSAEIRVEEVRKLRSFLSLSASEGGRRVVIVDSADEMMNASANALLKQLEEPPARTTFFLISHQPARLLPTIRSRCRELRLAPLSPEDMARALAAAGADTPGDAAPELAALSSGSVGEAMRISRLGGVELYTELVALFSGLPRPDRSRALKLADLAAARGSEDRFELLLTLVDLFLVRLARTGVTGQAPHPEAARGEADLLSRLSASPAQARAWATTAQQVSARTRHGRAVNLDPAALVLDTVWKIQQTAAG